MSALWTAADIASATGGRASGDFTVNGVDIDSRDVQTGTLFVALRGAQSDGHIYVDAAIAQGAAAVLVDRPVSHPHIVVPDTMAALNDLARAARARCTGKIIAVTGSVGKTGVKEAIRLALERMHPGCVHASIRSFNNHVGVPLTLARMPFDTRFAVLEMGMNHAGELTLLSQLARPHVAVITAIASAHRAFFVSEAAIADAKAEIFRGCAPDAVAVVNADSSYRQQLVAAAQAAQVKHIIGFGFTGDAEVRVQNAVEHADCSCVTADIMGTKLVYKIAQPGRHWIANSLAVLAVVAAVDGDLALAGLALGELPGLDGRGRHLAISLPDGEARLIDESYNANPASMQAALEVFAAQQPHSSGRKLLILGDMKELGSESGALHLSLLPAIQKCMAQHIILVGDEMHRLGDMLPQQTVYRATSAEDALAYSSKKIGVNDMVLIKGSNSMGLGQVVQALTSGLPAQKIQRNG